MNDQEHRRKSPADDLEVDLDRNADQNDRDPPNLATEADLVISPAIVAIGHVVDATTLEIVAQQKAIMKVATKNPILWRFSICITKLTKTS